METISEKNIDSMIIMISAYASIETAVKATKTGAFDFLPKPFTPEELKNTIRKAARHKITQLQAQKLAEEKRQVRFQFISVLSHELKAPLNAVEGYLKIVKDKSAGDDPAVYEHMIERCLTRMEYMRKLIFDLLDLTRIESGQKTRNLEQIDLLKPVKTAIENALPSAEERGISINLHTDSEEILFWADEGELEIMMNNLVSNAVKYNKDNGTVDITVKPNQDNVTISVADTGIGLSPDEKEKLFEDFVRIKNKKTKNILGSGLGLSTVKKLVKLYDGSIDVESEPDKGSTFTIVLYEKKPE
jgi:signal transduction histidine kinase